MEHSQDTTIQAGKNIATIAYLTLIGLIIAFVQNNDKKNAFASFHIRQCIGIFLCAFAIGVVSIIPILGWIVAIVGMLGLFICWVMGLISAINGQMKPLPVVGPLFQKWFASIQ